MLVSRILELIAKGNAQKWEIGYKEVSKASMQQLNRKYRSRDKPTDVLSFRYYKSLGPGVFPKTNEKGFVLGDIYVCKDVVVDYCMENVPQDGKKEENDKMVEERMKVVVVHGVCHVLGYDHESDEEYERMQKAEDYVLSIL